MDDNKLRRSTKYKVIAGVCGGLGEHFKIDPVIIRLIFIILIFAIPPLPFITYLVLWVVVPSEKASDKAPEKSEETPLQAEPVKDIDSSSPRTLSIFTAIVLIIVGLFFLLPGPLFRIDHIWAVITCALLLLLAGKVALDTWRDKNITLTRSAIILISVSYTIFIILHIFSLLSSWIFIEYTKNLIAGLIIITGAAILLKDNKQKIIISLITAGILIIIGIYSLANGNRQPFAKMMSDMPAWRFPSFLSRMNNSYNFNNYSGIIPHVTGVANADYKIENFAGRLDINDTTNIFEYQVDGINPVINTNMENGTELIKFSNNAANSKIMITRSLPVNLSIDLSAGSLDADLRNINSGNVSVNLSGGSVELDIGQNIRTLNIEGSMGNSSVHLPDNSDISISINSTMGNIDMPASFVKTGNTYHYNGNGKPLVINADVSMGNLKFDF